jgi:hypothetical protein
VPAEIAPTLCTSNANAPGCVQPGAVGIQVNSGVPDSLVPPLPLFTLTPAATVDEGSNWINMFYGPLSRTCLITAGCGTGKPFGAPLGIYSPTTGSPAIDAVPTTQVHPAFDFFGNPRPDGGVNFDIGAVEVGAPLSDFDVLVPQTWTPTAPRGVGRPGPLQVFTLTNKGNTTSTGITQATISGANAADFALVPVLSTCGPAGQGQLLSQTNLPAGASCTVTVQFRPATGKPGTRSATLSVSDSVSTQNSTLTGSN